MDRCPNCGQEVKSNAQYCPHCNFDLEKYQKEFFPESEKEKFYPTPARRSQETESSKEVASNPTVAAMIQWIKMNATIVFIVGFFLLILMSFSRGLGWFTFIALMVCLFVVSDRHPIDKEYTVNRRLTEKVDHVGSAVINHLESYQQKQDAKRLKKGKEPIDQELHEVVARRRSSTQLAVLLMAMLSSVIFFYGPFSSSSMEGFQDLSISKALLNVGSFGGKYVLFGYGLWLILFVIPLAIITLIVCNRKNSQYVVFGLSLTMTIILLYVAFQLIFRNAGAGIGITNYTIGNGVHAQRILANIISFGVSTYLLLVSSLITTWTAWRSMRQKSKSDIEKGLTRRF